MSNSNAIKVTHYHCDHKFNLLALITNNKKLFIKGKLKDKAKITYPTTQGYQAYIQSSNTEYLMAFPVEDLESPKHPHVGKIKSYIKYVETIENIPENMIENMIENKPAESMVSPSFINKDKELIATQHGTYEYSPIDVSSKLNE